MANSQSLQFKDFMLAYQSDEDQANNSIFVMFKTHIEGTNFGADISVFHPINKPELIKICDVELGCYVRKYVLYELDTYEQDMLDIAKALDIEDDDDVIESKIKEISKSLYLQKYREAMDLNPNFINELL